MGEFVDVVDSLENKVNRILQKMEQLKKANHSLKQELSLLKKEQVSTNQILADWEEKYNSLKMANAMLGSNVDKTEAKLKINALIRELDSCIAHLAE
ncbi:hypothetical protein GCM10011414_18590 [Croceivirga lutea]|uniref:hypothetical protein n=1 Tax=Croceivirga lutea TaxID=1775167 RepID=UPI00163AE37F|nr:hypothetical protein [Croceivirga lutea]GGG49058.1 hypothetical protein GCM10011414_18590 [Croceivirga lutea]